MDESSYTLHLHGLSTQVPTFHHVTRVVSSRPRNPSADSDFSEYSGPRESGTTSRPLGSQVFRLDGIPYYVTRRQKHRIPGTQTMYLNENSIITLTSIEQTMLDTLINPMACGGPSVVFEVWRTGIDMAEHSTFMRLLKEIDDPNLARRTGYMLTNLDMTDDAEEIADWIGDSDSYPTISLLPGMPYTEFARRWNIRVPR